MNTLEAYNLKKTYRQRKQIVEAVKSVSLTISSGEVLAFLGPNGAGKTTSIKMMAGLIKPDAGWVRIVGSDPHQNPTALQKLGAVLEGNRNVYWRLTPEENLEYLLQSGSLIAPKDECQGIKGIDTSPVFISGSRVLLEKRAGFWLNRLSTITHSRCN